MLPYRDIPAGTFHNMNVFPTVQEQEYEIEVMKKVSYCINIISMYDAQCFEDGSFIIFMEFAPCNLRQVQRAEGTARTNSV